MNRHDEPLPPDVEADVAALLTRALRSGDEPVDVAAVVAGTRRGVVRAAVRRRVSVVSAAVAAVAVPVAVVLLGPGAATRSIGPARSSAATASPTGGPAPFTSSPTALPSDGVSDAAPPPPTTSPADTGPSTGPAPSGDGTGAAKAVPTPPGVTVVPLASLPKDSDPNHVAYLVPESALLEASDFPVKLLRLSAGNDWDYRWTPTVPGQGCGSGFSPMPVAARQVSWAQENSNRLDQLSLTIVVSGWKPGTTAARFADITQNDGVCRWLDVPRAGSTAGMPGDEAWAATFRQNGLAVGRAAVRVGDVIVAVEVYDAKGGAAAVTLAERLVAVSAARVVSSGLAATAAAGG